MKQGTGTGTAAPTAETASQLHDQRIDHLLDRLPGKLQTAIRHLQRPSLRWVRVPAGVLFIAGTFLSILPIFGLWMLPVGLMLLAEDIPPLRRVRGRFLDWVERHRPHWFRGQDARSRERASTPSSSSVAGGIVPPAIVSRS
jgi:hypothetical protein